MVSARLLQAASKEACRGARSLHISLPAPSPSPLISTGSVAAFYLSRNVSELKQECKLRNLRAIGTRDELINRLSFDDISHSRKYSTGPGPKRPTVTSTEPKKPKEERSFNTSRALKANNDSSTIDFAFLPSVPEDPAQHFSVFHVPIAPDLFQTPSKASGLGALEEDGTVMRPQIATVASASTHIDPPSAMSEVLDNAAVPIDPFSLTKKVADSAAKLGGKKEVGEVRRVFNDFLDDLLGENKK